MLDNKNQVDNLIGSIGACSKPIEDNFGWKSEVKLDQNFNIESDIGLPLLSSGTCAKQTKQDMIDRIKNKINNKKSKTPKNSDKRDTSATCDNAMLPLKKLKKK